MNSKEYRYSVFSNTDIKELETEVNVFLRKNEVSKDSLATEPAVSTTENELTIGFGLYKTKFVNDQNVRLEVFSGENTLEVENAINIFLRKEKMNSDRHVATHVTRAGSQWVGLLFFTKQ